MKHNKLNANWTLALTSVGSMGLSSVSTNQGAARCTLMGFKGPIWRYNSILVAKYHQNCPFGGAQFPSKCQPRYGRHFFRTTNWSKSIRRHSLLTRPSDSYRFAPMPINTNPFGPQAAMGQNLVLNPRSEGGSAVGLLPPPHVALTKCRPPPDFPCPFFWPGPSVGQRGISAHTPTLLLVPETCTCVVLAARQGEQAACGCPLGPGPCGEVGGSGFLHRQAL
jgi:hypothetical protein